MIEKRILKVNYGKGRDGFKPEIVVIHIAVGTLKGTTEEFSAPQTQKSSHYFVNEEDVIDGENGKVIQFVDELNTAWCNGEVDKPTSEIVKSRPKINPNLYSISIEHEGIDEITPNQYQRSAELISDICERWNIPLTRKYIIGHREIKSTKTCPAKIDVDKLVQMATDIYKKKIEIKRQLPLLVQMVNALEEEVKKFISKLKK